MQNILLAFGVLQHPLLLCFLPESEFHIGMPPQGMCGDWTTLG